MSDTTPYDKYREFIAKTITEDDARDFREWANKSKKQGVIKFRNQIREFLLGKEKKDEERNTMEKDSQ